MASKAGDKDRAVWLQLLCVPMACVTVLSFVSTVSVLTKDFVYIFLIPWNASRRREDRGSFQ